VRITAVGALVNVGLSGAKGAAGLACGSTALLADAVHSLSDLVSDAATAAAVRLGRAPADEDHPYGHGKFEAVGAVSVSALLAAAGAATSVHALSQMQALLDTDILATASTAADPSVSTTGTLSLAVAAAVAAGSIAAKELLYRRTLAVARDIGSPSLLANAWHHRSDALSSFVALGGIGGSLAGVPALDPVAGVVVGGLILKQAADMSWSNLRELTDCVDPEALAQIERVALSVEGVRSVRRVRARQMGHYQLVDLRLQVDDARASVSAAQRVVDAVRTRVMEAESSAAEVLVHLETPALASGPDGAWGLTGVDGGPLAGAAHSHTFAQIDKSAASVDGEPADSSRGFAGRLEPRIRAAFAQEPGIRGVTHVTLHYLQPGGATAEVVVTADGRMTVDEVSKVARAARARAEALPGVASVDVHLEIHDGSLDPFPVDRIRTPLRDLRGSREGAGASASGAEV
jgi:cation diffusion facilitator family transporter